jgi:hypothetical protein
MDEEEVRAIVRDEIRRSRHGYQLRFGQISNVWHVSSDGKQIAEDGQSVEDARV